MNVFSLCIKHWTADLVATKFIIVAIYPIYREINNCPGNMLSPGLRVYTRISLNFFNTNLETFHTLQVPIIWTG